MKPPIHPEMKAIIREDDRVLREERKKALAEPVEEKPKSGWHGIKERGEKLERAKRRTKMDRDRTRPDRKWETSEEIQEAVERFQKNGGTIQKIPPGGYPQEE